MNERVAPERSRAALQHQQPKSKPSGLLAVVTTRPRRMTAYQALQQAGYIRSATEYLEEDR